jgi:hypothetical protein
VVFVLAISGVEEKLTIRSPNFMRDSEKKVSFIAFGGPSW